MNIMDWAIIVGGWMALLGSVFVAWDTFKDKGDRDVY